MTWSTAHRPDIDPFTSNCRYCGRRLVTFAGTYYRHAKPVCDAPMRYGERCARAQGHADDHRTRYALDNQARMASAA